jgi:hypothetical protein
MKHFKQNLNTLVKHQLMCVEWLILPSFNTNCWGIKHSFQCIQSIMPKAGQLSQHSAWGYWPDDSSIVLRFPPRATYIPHLQASKMALGHTQPNVQGVTTLFRGVKQNAQFHIVQRWIMRGVTPLRHHMASMKYSTFHLVVCLVSVRSTVQISDRKSVITEGFRPVSQSLLLYQLVYII